MAERQQGSNSNQGSQQGNNAQDMVFDNLGISADDVGAEFGADDADEGGDQEQQYVGPGDDEPPRGREQQLDDLSVSHTRSRQQEESRPFPRGAEVQPDQHGNLIDPQTGQVVARAGREANLYQRGFKAGEGKKVGGLQYRLNQRENQLRQAIQAGKQLSEELRTFQGHQEALKQYRIEPNDQIAAFKMYSDLKTRPAETLKALLTRAAASGINVAELGVPGVTGPDARSLVEMVREEIAKATGPIEERNRREKELQTERDRQQQQQRQVESEVQGFFAENPDATPYMEVFEKVLSQPEFRHMSLGEVWARIQLNRMRSGQNGRAPQGQNRGRNPRPAGRALPPADTRNSNAPAPVSMTYDEILKGVLGEHGIR